MGTVLEDAREAIRAINANLSAAPSGVRPHALYGRVNPKTGKVEWHRRPRRVRWRSGYPFYSMSLNGHIRHKGERLGNSTDGRAGARMGGKGRAKGDAGILNRRKRR